MIYVLSKYSKKKHKMIILHKSVACVKRLTFLFLIIWLTLSIKVTYLCIFFNKCLFHDLTVFAPPAAHFRHFSTGYSKCKMWRTFCFHSDSTWSQVIHLSALPQIQHLGFPLDLWVSHKVAFRWFTYRCTFALKKWKLFTANLLWSSPAIWIPKRKCLSVSCF